MQALASKKSQDWILHRRMQARIDNVQKDVTNAIHLSANFCCHCHGQFGTAQPNAKLRNFRISDTQLTWARWKILQYPSLLLLHMCEWVGPPYVLSCMKNPHQWVVFTTRWNSRPAVANPMADLWGWHEFHREFHRHPFPRYWRSLGMVSYWFHNFHMDFYCNGLKQLKTCLSFSNWPDTIWLQTSVAACSSSPCRSIDRGLTLMSIIEGYGSKKQRYPTKHTGVRTLFCHRSKKLHPLWHPEGWACNEGWKRRWSTWSC